VAEWLTGYIHGHICFSRAVVGGIYQFDSNISKSPGCIRKNRKFSKSAGRIRKIPLNPPLQKGEAGGMPEFIEKRPFNLSTI